MKKVLFLEPLSVRLSKNRQGIKLAFVVLLAGLMLGLLFGLFKAEADLDEASTYFQQFLSAYCMQGVSKTETFSLALLNYSVLFFCIFLSGRSPWLFPLGLLQAFLKTFRLSFSFICLMQCFHFKGILFSFLALFLQTIILLPTLCLLLAEQWHFLQKKKHAPRLKNQQLFLYLLSWLIFFLPFLFCALWEGFVVPSLFSAFSSIFLT